MGPTPIRSPSCRPCSPSSSASMPLPRKANRAPRARRPAEGDAVRRARHVFAIEIAALETVSGRLDERFDHAVQILAGCRGKVVVTGIGKSGLICRKIAATLASTGTPAAFLHAAEAAHGDFGVVGTDDIIVALSYSGETEEIVRLI